MFSCEYCEIFRNLYFKGNLSTTASELYLFKVEEITEKTETYLETIIGDVFRTHWNILNKDICKNSCLYLPINYFCNALHIICFTGLRICLDMTGISANLFSNHITSPWDINHKMRTRVFHFKLTHPFSWIHTILVSHYLLVETHHNGKEMERKLHSIVLLT